MSSTYHADRILAGLGVLTLCGCGPRDETPLAAPPVIQVANATLEPIVAIQGETFRFTLEIRGTRARRAVLTTLFQTRLTRAGASIDRLELFDDETHGDAKASDGIFTSDGLALAVGSRGVAADNVVFKRIEAMDDAGTEQSRDIDLIVSFRVIDTAIVSVPDPTCVGLAATATSHLLSLVRENAMSLDEPDVAEHVLRYFEVFPEDRDFIVVHHALPTQGEGWSSRAFQLLNSDLGIGLAARVFRQWGATGPLALVVQSRVDGYDDSRNPSFCLLNHELMHRWAAYVPALASSGHWKAPLPGRSTSAFGDQTGTCALNDLELYLAGFLPPDSVSQPLSADGYTISRLIGDVGGREPRAAASQRLFRIAFIAVSRRPLTRIELAYFHHTAREYANPTSALATNWSMATGQRSSLDGVLTLPTPAECSPAP